MYEPEPAIEWRRSAAAMLDHPSGFLALSKKNRIFALDGAPGFIAYREQGKHLVAFGGVHAPQTSWEPLLDGFLEEASHRRRRVMAVQVREAQVQLFTTRAFTVNQFGTSFALALQGYSLGGTRKMKLRNKIQRARKAGLRVAEVGWELPRDERTFATLRDISTTWLAAKGRKELDFMIGEVGHPGDAERRIFVVLDQSDCAVAFITYVPEGGARPGYLHDLTRRKPSAPVGAMELCNATAIERFRSEGTAYLHFGFTPFVVDEEGTPGSSKVMQWIIRKVYTYGQSIYPAKDQAHYKLKWGPDIVEREYLATRPLTPRAMFDLLMLTRVI